MKHKNSNCRSTSTTGCIAYKYFILEEYLNILIKLSHIICLIDSSYTMSSKNQ